MLTEDPTLHQNPGGSLLRNRTLLRKQTWSREQLFMDVSHNTVSRKYKDPCSTVSGPRNGVPCKFPFVYPDCSVCINCCSGGLTPKQYNKCGSDISGVWCYTKTYLNDSAIIGEWGYCDPSCNSEVHFNLASIENDDLWSEDIFRIQIYSSGHCHTYNPADSSFSGDRGSFYAKLGLHECIFIIIHFSFLGLNKERLRISFMNNIQNFRNVELQPYK